MAAAGSVESYDTPMGDYDISMQSGPPNIGDQWYTTETVMDDGEDSFARGLPGQYESVEVDMHENANEDLEYDMADNDVYTQLDASDVELHDAGVTGDASMLTEGHAELSFLQHAPEESMVSQELASTIPAIAKTEMAESIVAHEEVHFENPLRSATSADAENASFDFTNANTHPLAISLSSSADAQPIPLVATEIVTETSQTEAEAVVINVTQQVASADEATQDPLATSGSNAEASVTQDVPKLADPTDSNAETDEPAHHVNKNAKVEISEQPQEQPQDSSNLSHDFADEPPYPVTMVFRLDGQDQIWNLFTLGDEADESEADTSVPAFLHDRVDFFHRPLSDFFTHLRELDFVQRDPEFSRGELLLEVYELDLHIAEDNIFSRQVAFRDLTFLHKGYPLSGPLRIRISFNLNSFRARYTDLSARAAATQDADDTNEIEYSGEGQDEPQNQDVGVNGREGQHVALEVPAQGNNHHMNIVAQTGTLQSEIPLNPSENNQNEEESESLEAHQDEQVAAPFADGDDTADDREDEGPGEELDAERVHDESADNPASTGVKRQEGEDEGQQLESGVGDYPEADERANEYEEHENDIEDDDERFGEELPADEGGDSQGVGDKGEVELGHDGDAQEQEIWEKAADEVIPTFTPKALASAIEHKSANLELSNKQRATETADDDAEAEGRSNEHSSDDHPEQNETEDDEAGFDVSQEELDSWEVGDETAIEPGADTTAEDDTYYEEAEGDDTYDGLDDTRNPDDAENEWDEEDNHPDVPSALTTSNDDGGDDVPDNEADKEHGLPSTESSVTLSSGTGTSKRGFDDIGDDEVGDEVEVRTGSPSGTKRARVD